MTWPVPIHLPASPSPCSIRRFFLPEKKRKRKERRESDPDLATGDVMILSFSNLSPSFFFYSFFPFPSFHILTPSLPHSIPFLFFTSSLSTPSPLTLHSFLKRPHYTTHLSPHLHLSLFVHSPRNKTTITTRTQSTPSFLLLAVSSSHTHLIPNQHTDHLPPQLPFSPSPLP